MIPQELILRNFMCYREDLPPLKLDGLHVACLSGENGAGKSALLEAIIWALWGKARLKDDDLITLGETEMQVEMIFQLNGQCYRVIRRRQRARSGSRSSGKSSLDLQVRNEDNWRSLGESTLAETERVIEQLLRMRYETFINASFLLQGRADEFTRKTAGERKQVLADILDLQEYALLEERARQRAKRLDGEIKGIDGLIAHLQQQADQLEIYEQFVRDSEERVAALSEKLSNAEVEQRETDDRVRDLETKADQHKALRRQLATLHDRRREQEQEIAALQARIGESEALLQRSDAIAEGMQVLRAARAEQERLEGLRPRYEELREQRAQLQDVLREELRRLRSDRDRWLNEQQRLTAQVERRPQVEGEQTALERRMEALTALHNEARTLRERIAGLDERISRIQGLLLQRSELNNTIERQRSSLAAVRDEQQRGVKRLERQLRDEPRWRADLEAALAQQQAVEEQSVRLEALRERERAATTRIGELRALRAQEQRQIEQIERDRARLAKSPETTCPLCHSDLGHDGIAHVLAHYDSDSADLSARQQSYDREIRDLGATLDAINDQMRDVGAQLDQARQQAARVEMLRQQLAQADEWRRELEQARIRRDSAVRQLDAQDFAPDERAALRKLDADLADLGLSALSDTQQASGVEALDLERTECKRQLTSHERQLEERAGFEAQVARLQHELEEITRAAAELPATNRQLAALDDQIEHGDFAHETRVAGRAIDADLAALGYSVEVHNAASEEVRRLAHWIDEERRLDEARIRLEGDQQLLRQANEIRDQRNAEIESITGESAVLEQALQALPKERQRAQACAQVVAEQRRELDAATRDREYKRSLRDNARQSAEQLVQEQGRRAALVERLGVFQELTEAFGKKGVQAMLIEMAIPQIEDEANRLLARMTSNQMHVAFEMQRATKRGDTVETLEINIADALGTRIYDAFSGGEAMRVNFAIRIALSRLLARRAGASLETLVIDEGFGALDADGRERFIEAITSVQQDFRRILVITHIDELKERFPIQIEVIKTDQGSRWVMR